MPTAIRRTGEEHVLRGLAMDGRFPFFARDEHPEDSKVGESRPHAHG